MYIIYIYIDIDMYMYTVTTVSKMNSVFANYLLF